jgi:hypothetical protein
MNFSHPCGFYAGKAVKFTLSGGFWRSLAFVRAFV